MPQRGTVSCVRAKVTALGRAQASSAVASRAGEGTLPRFHRIIDSGRLTRRTPRAGGDGADTAAVAARRRGERAPPAITGSMGARCAGNGQSRPVRRNGSKLADTPIEGTEPSNLQACTESRDAGSSGSPHQDNSCSVPGDAHPNTHLLGHSFHSPGPASLDAPRRLR
jgi:hypothetical protein